MSTLAACLVVPPRHVAPPDFLGVDWLDGWYDVYTPHTAPPPDRLAEFYRDDTMARRWDDDGRPYPVVRRRFCPDDPRTYAVIAPKEASHE